MSHFHENAKFHYHFTIYNVYLKQLSTNVFYLILIKFSVSNFYCFFFQINFQQRKCKMIKTFKTT